MRAEKVPINRVTFPMKFFIKSRRIREEHLLNDDFVACHLPMLHESHKLHCLSYHSPVSINVKKFHAFVLAEVQI